MNTRIKIGKIENLMAALAIIFLVSCTGDKKREHEESRTPTAVELNSESEWIDLFDGASLNGWKRYGADEIGTLWKVEDGAIVCYAEGGGEADESQGGSLITNEKFGNFELQLDWKISPGGNSGILYHVVEKGEYGRAYETGPEYQLLDEPAYGDISALNSTASSYDLYAPAEDKVQNPPGEWNTSKIIYNNGHVEHWLNDVKVLEFEEGSDDWKERYEKSKWKEYPGWCQYKSGAIGLQDHGHKIWFRNIRIKVD